jgi:thioredoxin 1
MAYIANYSEDALDRAEIDALPGAVLVEFGANWCGHCQGAQPLIEAALRDFPDLRCIKVEDGPGRRLGRSFRVKLWPTLVFIKDGLELERLVRPASEAEIRAALARLTGA